eukprot:1954209-Amphidinium_carterae.1
MMCDAGWPSSLDLHYRTYNFARQTCQSAQAIHDHRHLCLGYRACLENGFRRNQFEIKASLKCPSCQMQQASCLCHRIKTIGFARVQFSSTETGACVQGLFGQSSILRLASLASWM